MQDDGLSVVELIVVVTILGILIGIGFTQLNPNGAATRQTAEVMAAAVNRARFEAVRTNSTAGLKISAGVGGASGTLEICRYVDETVTLSCNTGETAEIIDLSDGDLARARIATPSVLTVFFDRRGIVRNPSSGLTVTITDRSGGNVRTVTILPTGRAEVN